MRFDPLKWSAVTDEKPRKGPAGLLHVMSTSDQAQVWVEADGIEALAGVGCDVKVKVSPPYRFAVKVPKGHHAQVYEPVLGATVPSGPRFTNIDRMEVGSTHVDAVKKAVREMQVEQFGMLREIKRQRADMRREAQDARKKPDPVDEVETLADDTSSGDVEPAEGKEE